MTRPPRIGLFDSGVGGLSVLQAVRRRLPDADLHYVADAGHAPYGERGDAHVLARSERIARHLVENGAQMLVVACNTATAAAVAALRSGWPGLPVVGVEPGIRPAAALSRNGRIGVLATQGTLASPRFSRLVETHGRGARFLLQACTGLAAAIEAGGPEHPAIEELVEAHCRPLRDAGVDVAVLGCTHYVFAAGPIARALGPKVTLVDTADAVARRVTDLARAIEPGGPVEPGAYATSARLHVETSGDAAGLARFAARWLGHRGPVGALPPTV